MDIPVTPAADGYPSNNMVSFSGNARDSISVIPKVNQHNVHIDTDGSDGKCKVLYVHLVAMQQAIHMFACAETQTM